MSTLLEKLHKFTNAVFNNETLTSDPDVRDNGLVVMNEIKTQGFALRKEIADKQARPVFVQIQASSERKAVDEIAKATNADTEDESQTSSTSTSVATEKDETTRKAYVQLQVATEKALVNRLHSVKDFGRLARSIWIIHTPVIATPCVTNGEATPKLLAEEIAQDETRRKLTLSRAHIIRDYLQEGGILIVAYDKDQRQEEFDAAGKIIKKGRTAEQVDIYEKLRAEYPLQIIDFPIDLKARQLQLGLPNTDYPADLIGATYLMEDTNNQKFEMTNLGVQANDPRDDATWGVWMQNRSQNIPQVNARMGLVFDFLQNAGLNQVLNDHAQKHGIDSDEFAPLLSRYMSLEMDVKTGIGCRVQ